MHSFLIESALLTHGLVSISNEEMLRRWPQELDNIAWVDAGRVVIGSMAEFLPFRDRASELCRISYDRLSAAQEEGLSGALTASGTMAVCQQMGLPLAVTCGMGGIGEIHSEALCPDLPALRDIPVALLSTSPKDMLDIPATIQWLTDSGVQVLGIGEGRCTGYLFQSADVPLSGAWNRETLLQEHSRLLLLHPIPAHKRVGDLALLAHGIAAGKQAEAEGREYHPAANAAFDRLTGGYSSQIQFESICANALLAARLTRAK